MKKELLDENKRYPDRLDRTRQDRNEIRWLISAGIEKTLTDAGFMRQNTSYFRIYGDYFFQVISVSHRAYCSPTVEVDMCVLYGFDECWACLDRVHGCIGFEGDTIETLAGLRIKPGDFNTYLSDVNVFGPSIKKEVETLEKYTLPYLQEIRTVNDYRAFRKWDKKKETIFRLGPYLRVKDYESAERVLTAEMKDHPPYLTTRNFYGRRIKGYPLYGEPDGEFYPRVETENQRLLTAIRERDEKVIYQYFNDNIEFAYFMMNRYIPGFVKRNPMPRIEP